MAIFEYQALTSSNRLMKGTIEADSRDDARSQLEQMALEVRDVAESRPEHPPKGVGRSEFMLFNQQLASMTKAGIPLERGLREILTDVGSKSMRTMISAVADDLEAGVDIAEALGKHERSLPPLYGRIVRAGVQSGRLPEMLISLNRHMEVSGRTRRILAEAAVYPAVVLTLAAALLTFVFVWVVPGFGDIVVDAAPRLSWMTRALLYAAGYVWQFWIGVGALIVGVILLVLAARASRDGRRLIEVACLHIPVLGRLYRLSLLARLADAMALLVGAGCDMPTCLRLGADATASETFGLECGRVAGQIEQGCDIVDAGRAARWIPSLFFYSMRLGSQRNELRDNLYGLAEMYSRQCRADQGRLQALLTPTLIILVGGVIGMVIVAMFMPLIGMVQSVGM